MSAETNQRPPRLAILLLTWFSKDALIEDLLGDLEELFSNKVKETSLISAQLWYWRHILSLFFSYGLRKRKKQAVLSPYHSANQWDMLRNHTKIAFRNLKKDKFFTVINVFGMSLGMSVCLLYVAMMNDVIRFDEFHKNKDNIYRVLTRLTEPSGQRKFASTFEAVGESFKSGHPGVIDVVSIQDFHATITFDYHDFDFKACFTDPSYFKVFTFDLKHGNKQSALAKPNSVIISPSVADRLFKNKNPIGETLMTGDLGSLTITGVLKEHPKQTHLSFDLLISSGTSGYRSTKQKWSDITNSYVYLLTEKDKSLSDFDHMLGQLATESNTFLDDKTVDYELQAFTDINPGKNLYRDLAPFDWLTSFLFLGISLLILIPACFNYINLSVARALKRAKEIGIRKVVGSQKKQIISQFLMETIILTLIALLGSIYLFTVIRQEFISMLVGSETLELTITPIVIVCFVVFAILTGLAAGLFPAIYLSKMNPIHALKGNGSTKVISISSVRKTLITAQLSLSLVFMIGVAAVAKQYSHMLSYNIGFDEENILIVNLKDADQKLAFQEFSSLNEVKSIALSSSLPGLSVDHSSYVFFKNENPDSLKVDQIFTDPHFLPALKLELVWGNNFTPHSSSNYEPVIVNEAFMKAQRPFLSQNDSLILTMSNNRKYLITGIVRDFNNELLDRYIQPLIIHNAPEKTEFALLRLHSNDLIQTIDRLESKWETLPTTSSFESEFLDDKIETGYYHIIVLIKIFAFLSTLSITISCIGILGMVVYMTENRAREVAIRKVMGAGVFSLYQLLGHSFVKMMLIATGIAIPLSYFFYDKLLLKNMNKYTEGVGISELLIGTGFMLLLGGFAIFSQVSKIARVNPASNLRSE